MSVEGIIDETKRRQLSELCARFGVRTLELFGSGAKGQFDPDTSDLDFLVEFEGLTARDAADRYFGLLFALEDLFNREIDLVDVSAVDNPYFLRCIAPSRRVLYAA
jgi:uncharacterized protein